MGGFGSGQRSSRKDTTSVYLQLDVRRWQRAGLLAPGQCFSWQWSLGGKEVGSIAVRVDSGRVILTYPYRSNQESMNGNHLILLEWTPCNYGGERAWFVCPARDCGKRVAVLYGGSIFICRHCRRLSYDSQIETAHSRALRRVQAIRMKLGGSPSLIEDFPPKPRGMQRRTYERLTRQAAEAENRYWPQVHKLFGLGDRC